MASHKNQGATQAKLTCRWPEGKSKAQPCVGWGIMAPNKEIEKRPCRRLPAPCLLMGATTGELPPQERCHHRRQVKRHGSFWTSPSCSGALVHSTVQVEDPTPRLGQAFAVGYRIPRGRSWSASPSLRPPPPHPLSLLEGFRPWQQSKRGESTFPSSLSSEGREPGPLDPDASTWPRTIGTSSACSLLANPHHLFPSFPRQARNQSSRSHR